LVFNLHLAFVYHIDIIMDMHLSQLVWVCCYCYVVLVCYCFM